MKYKRKYNTGGEFDAAGAAAGIGGGLTSVASSVASGSKNKTIGSIIGAGVGGALTVLTAGAAAPLIPAMSSLGGSIGGKVDANKQDKLNEYAKLQQSSNMSAFRYGGHFSKPAAEVEGEEVMVKPDGNVKFYNGKSHEKGGIMVDRAGNPTANTGYKSYPYIYSNKIDINGKPASDVVTRLAKRSNSFTDSITKNTINKVKQMSDATKQYYQQQAQQQEGGIPKFGGGDEFKLGESPYSTYTNPWQTNNPASYQAPSADPNNYIPTITDPNQRPKLITDDFFNPVSDKQKKPPGKDENKAFFTKGDFIQLGAMGAVGLTDLAMSGRKPAQMHDRYMHDAMSKTNAQQYSNEAENNRRIRNRASYFDTISNSYRSSNTRAAALSGLYAQDDLNTGSLAQNQQQIRNQILQSQAQMYMGANSADKQTLSANWSNLAEQNRLRRDAVGTIGNAAARLGQNYNANLTSKLALSAVGTTDFKAEDWSRLVSGQFKYPVEYMGKNN
jgi:hypothetical protein